MTTSTLPTLAEAAETRSIEDVERAILELLVLRTKMARALTHAEGGPRNLQRDAEARTRAAQYARTLGLDPEQARNVMWAAQKMEEYE